MIYELPAGDNLNVLFAAAQSRRAADVKLATSENLSRYHERPAWLRHKRNVDDILVEHIPKQSYGINSILLICLLTCTEQM